jgi:segregation and condensation protein B
MNKRALLEAALFVSDKPLSLERLSKILNSPESEVRGLISEMKNELLGEGRGIELVEVPEGYELRVKSEYRKRVVGLAPLADLGAGMMRTLAIVAIKQPIKQSLIVKYQGNKTYGYIRELENKGLINTEKCGRTKLVRTTHGFERYFGKTVEEIRDMLREQLKS